MKLFDIDDGSVDDTFATLASYGGRITVLAQQNGGPGAARNLAASKAGGVIWQFLDSDDLWLPWTLSCYRSAIEQARYPAFVSAAFRGCGDL